MELRSSTSLEKDEETKEELLCAICYAGGLASKESCVKLSCSHWFHTECVRLLLDIGWSTLNITFGFMSCPQCK